MSSMFKKCKKCGKDEWYDGVFLCAGGYCTECVDRYDACKDERCNPESDRYDPDER